MSNKSKKSQGMPINVIIVAALALMVLVIIAAIFTGRVRIFSQNLEDCGAKQGLCKKDCDTGTEAKISNVKCPNKDLPTCCVQVLNS